MTEKNEAWFEDIYLSNQAAVMRYIGSRVNSHSVVQDIFATTFEVAWKQKDSLTDHVQPFLIAVARNQIRKYWRELGRGELHLTSLDEISQTLDFEDSTVDAITQKQLIHTVLSELSETDCEILLLAYWDDLSQSDIAQVLGLSDVSVRVKLHRARSRADKILAKLDSQYREVRIDQNRSQPKGVTSYEV
ncbi:MAG: hypothetical protein RL038_293 [Actinomycetota bacterium]|jgi:RNA polymerase sigma-70 factor (ECF subfamily)